jgi:tetratricopeptide (TPR) repeat protein
MLASHFEALCNAANSDQDGFCWRADMVRMITEISQDDVLAQLDRYEPESTEQIMLAALAGDVSYANGDSDSAIEIWRQFLSAEMLVYRARVAVQRQDHRVAFALLASLGQGYVPDSGQQRTYLAAVLAQLARFSAESANFAEAELYWRWAALQLPEQAAYYYGLGQALAHQERWDEAAAAYVDAIDLDPNRAHFYAGLAHALVRLGETDQAVGAARRALELDPDNAAAQRLLQRLGQD